MRSQDSAVSRLSPPLIAILAHSPTRLAICSGQSHPGFCRSSQFRHFQSARFFRFLWLKVRPIDVKVTWDFYFRSLWALYIHPKTRKLRHAHFNHQAHVSSALAVYEHVRGSCRPRLVWRGTWSTRDAAQMANFRPKMAFLVVTVARKPKTTQMQQHGQRPGRAPSKEGAGLHFAVGGISTANNPRMPAPT